MTKPVRLQLSRARGFNLEKASRAANGLPAIIVSRPRRFGNPFRVGECADLVQLKKWDWTIPTMMREIPCRDSALAVELFSLCLCFFEDEVAPAVRELRGHNLACWCPIGDPCHADTLLELANK